MISAAVCSNADGDAAVTSAHHSTPLSSTHHSGPQFRLVTELSVNIDAEEGEEILYEMSQLALLESLLVDSTDEFRWAAVCGCGGVGGHPRVWAARCCNAHRCLCHRPNHQEVFKTPGVHSCQLDLCTGMFVPCCAESCFYAYLPSNWSASQAWHTEDPATAQVQGVHCYLCVSAAYFGTVWCLHCAPAVVALPLLLFLV